MRQLGASSDRGMRASSIAARRGKVNGRSHVAGGRNVEPLGHRGLTMTAGQVERERVRGLVAGPTKGLGGELDHGVTLQATNRIARRLVLWGRSNFAPYPWRFGRNAWLSFMTEFLLQRTRASQVASEYKRLAQRFWKPDEVAGLGDGEVAEITAGLGLPGRGASLRAIAQQVVRRNGRLPESMEDLCRFRGVGMYTAAAWLSLHRGKRAVILDANICRWLSRLTGRRYNRDPRNVRWVQRLAEDLTPRLAFRDYNYAVLDFTMKICVSERPRCTECPIAGDCRYVDEA